MTTRITEDILLGLMQLGMADQSMLANVRYHRQRKYWSRMDLRHSTTSLVFQGSIIGFGGKIRRHLYRYGVEN